MSKNIKKVNGWEILSEKVRLRKQKEDRAVFSEEKSHGFDRRLYSKVFLFSSGK